MSNSLVAVHPELVAEWSEKNLPLTPDNVIPSNNIFLKHRTYSYLFSVMRWLFFVHLSPYRASHACG